MKKVSLQTPSKAMTGIVGLDEITGGGWPRESATLIEGGPGTGKTVLALQSLVNGARYFEEPGIFVACEENSKRVIANAAKFGWDLMALQRKKLFFLDAQPKADLIQSGTFDLLGMLAVLTAKAEEMKAKRIVFDAVDVLLNLLNDPQAERREAYRLHEWLQARRLAAIITCKRDAGEPIQARFGFLQFMVDCAVLLKHDLVQGISQRSLRVLKYRGSSFDENESQFLIGRSGLEVADTWLVERALTPVSNKRVSSGVKRLDTVLGGGYYVSSTVLITGAPGSAKTTLCGAFAESACRRGDPTVFVSFDSDSSHMVRNLNSVGIGLDSHLRNGSLKVISVRSIGASAETHLMRIKSLAKAHGARCVVVDPVSALSKTLGTHSVIERLLDWAKFEGITLLCTSLLDAAGSVEAGAPQISTLADTWIHLSYLVHAGERNRALSVIKSRGSAHSNQVRELVLSEKGVTLTDAYTAGGDVLMGTLRWEKERASKLAKTQKDAVMDQKRAELEAEEAELELRVRALRNEIDAKRSARNSIFTSTNAAREREMVDRLQLRELRRADVPVSRNK
jgi:circadian clock protein KaiC